jgi:1-deoxy-D-xylulose 5-phosphate reductoisomerase
VEAFLRGKAGFCDIPKLIERAMAQHRPLKRYSLPEILAVDEETRKRTREWVSS